MNTKIDECECGCATPTPCTNLGTVNGIGNAVPASSAAMTGAEQTSTSCKGSGDKWDTISDKNKKRKRKYVVTVPKDDNSGMKVVLSTESMSEAQQFVSKLQNPLMEIYVITKDE